VIVMIGREGTGLREEVRARYAEAARVVLEPEGGAAASCCGAAADSCCGAAADSCCGAGARVGGGGRRFQ
jgi:hypothetical protein